jgi:hypothetical protein
MFSARRSRLAVGEAQINRYSTPLLFLQAVRIDASEGLHQCGFPVIDVACRANDDRFHVASV